jgi:hypothetical protein
MNRPGKQEKLSSSDELFEIAARYRLSSTAKLLGRIFCFMICFGILYLCIRSVFCRTIKIKHNSFKILWEKHAAKPLTGDC